MVKDKWWKAAAELKAGDILETADEQCQRVKSITVEEKGYPVTTYNLSVEDNHTFFVNNEGILTHNMAGFKPCEVAEEIPIAFKQKEFASSYASRISQTPAELNKKVKFEGNRGESLCKLKPPPDPDLKKILDEAGIEGINYRNGVPDFSRVSKAELEIEYMVGGKDKMGTKAREVNFVQADRKLAEQLNSSQELAKKLGIESGEITEKDIRKFRKKNKFTWHELNDCKTMQLVPSKINNSFGHVGGVGEVNAGAFEPGGFANR